MGLCLKSVDKDLWQKRSQSLTFSFFETLTGMLSSSAGWYNFSIKVRVLRFVANKKRQSFFSCFQK